MNNIAPSLSNDLFYKETSGPKDSFRGFMSSARNFSKCSKQIWSWPSLSKFAFLIRTSHFLKSLLFLRAVDRWKLIHLLESLGVLFEHPTTAHSTILELMLSSLKLVRFGRDAQGHHARHPSLQHGFQNGGRSNCSATELFTVTVRLKGKFTS